MIYGDIIKIVVPIVITQITGFHFKIFAPSNIPIGSKLKNAKKLLMVNPKLHIKYNMGENDMNGIKAKNIAAKAI